MSIRVSALCIAAFWLGIGAARAQSAPPNPDMANVIGEAKYQIGVLSERVMFCAVQVGRDTQEVARLTAELATVKAELEKLKPAKPPDNPPETPK